LGADWLKKIAGKKNDQYTGEGGRGPAVGARKSRKKGGQVYRREEGLSVVKAVEDAYWNEFCYGKSRLSKVLIRELNGFDRGGVAGGPGRSAWSSHPDTKTIGGSVCRHKKGQKGGGKRGGGGGGEGGGGGIGRTTGERYCRGLAPWKFQYVGKR